MNNLNLDMLLTTPDDDIVSDVNQVFSNLLNEIHKYLGLSAINSSVEIIISDDLDGTAENFFDFGVRRSFKDNLSQIEISKKNLEYIQLILLREAYLCFIPEELREKRIIQIVIYEVLENDLTKLEVMKQWKTLMRTRLINYDFLSEQFDKLNKFFRLEGTEKTQSPTQFFFDYIRRNASLIQDKFEAFYDIISEEYVYKNSKSLYTDELVETIRVLVKIFYEIKLFKQYSEFEEYFQEFKEKGIISTNLSRRKFSENLRWMNKCTIISPSFQLNYHKIGLVVVYSILKFNPILPRKDIYKIINKIPFIRNPIFMRDGFSEGFFGTFILPRAYLEDLKNFIEKLNYCGYITNKESYIWKEYDNILNLNYFRSNFRDLSGIISPSHKDYDNRLELICSCHYDDPHKAIDLNLLEWIIFERVRETSLAGFGFERREETLQSLKDELLDNIQSERALISDLRSSLNVFYESPRMKAELLDFIENNKIFGVFYADDMLQRILRYLDLVEKIIAQHHEIKNLITFRQFLQHNQISQVIEENIFFKKKDIQSMVFRDFLPLYFRSNQEYVKLKEKYSYFLNFFESCKKLRIYSISWMKKILNNKELPEKIYSEKENKLKQSFEKFKPYKITNQEIDAIFRRFLENDLITPSLLNTITTSSFAKYHPIILLKDTVEVNTQLQKIVRFFPRVLLNRFRNLLNNEPVVYIFTFLLNIKEKELFCSILFNIFKEDIINFKRLFTSGLYPILFLKDFYDLTKNEFFYTKDLFGQQFLEIQKVLGDQQNPPQEIETSYPEKFWSKEKNILDLVKKVGTRVSHEKINFNIDVMPKLIDFHDNLNTILLNPESFKNAKQKQFFKNYIKSIKFIPNFQAFGLSQFYLYIHPSNIDEIDLKHLLINSFQTIKYPTIIDKTNSFLIKYIFPYDNPNMKHLNWYTKTKRIILEYCLFSIKTIHQILNFNYNLSGKGWDYDSNRFKIYFQNILFNPNYKIEFPKIPQFDMEKSAKQDFEGPNSSYFQALSKIYTHRSIDLKSYLGSRLHSTIDNILTLLKQNLIFPYISLKNLDFQDKVYLILPNVKEEYNQTINKIFNFFNYGFISEIEGQYYIYGVSDDNPIKFENGLMIKLYLPQCEVDEFLRLFDLLFEYLEIDDYVVLADLTNGKTLLKEIYRDLSFLDSYNPITNLKWNKKDKIWMNHKLYTEKFEKIYPDLIPPDKINKNN